MVRGRDWKTSGIGAPMSPFACNMQLGMLPVTIPSPELSFGRLIA
jgi:hypothetical protein